VHRPCPRLKRKESVSRVRVAISIGAVTRNRSRRATAKRLHQHSDRGQQQRRHGVARPQRAQQCLPVGPHQRLEPLAEPMPCRMGDEDAYHCHGPRRAPLTPPWAPPLQGRPLAVSPFPLPHSRQPMARWPHPAAASTAQPSRLPTPRWQPPAAPWSTGARSSASRSAKNGPGSPAPRKATGRRWPAGSRTRSAGRARHLGQPRLGAQPQPHLVHGHSGLAGLRVHEHVLEFALRADLLQHRQRAVVQRHRPDPC